MLLPRKRDALPDAPHPIVGHFYRARMPRPVAYNQGAFVNDRLVVAVHDTGMVISGKPVLIVEFENLSTAPRKTMYLDKWLKWVSHDVTDGWMGWTKWNEFLALRASEVPPTTVLDPSLVLLDDARELLQASRISTGRSAELTQDSGLAKLDQAIAILRKHQEDKIRKSE